MSFYIQQLAKAAAEKTAKRGLWDNVHAKRKRGEKPAKPGDKNYPDEKSWKKTTKEAGLFYRDLDKPRSIYSLGQEVKEINPEGFFDEANRTGNSETIELDVARLREPRYLTRLFHPTSDAETAYAGVIDWLNEQAATDPSVLNSTPEGRATLASQMLKRLSSTFGDIPEDFDPGKGDIFDLYNYDKSKNNYQALGLDSGLVRTDAVKPIYSEDKENEEDKEEKKAALKAILLEKVAAKSPAWQRKAGKNSEGGLNAAGRKSYNRETGGNLKAPVTQKNPKGKAKKRKASFCARMSGMKKKNTSKSTANDPDSRINKSLRKWNC